MLTGWGQETPEIVPPEVRLKSYTQNYNYGGGSSYSGNWYGWTWSGSGSWSGWHNINWNSATGGSERYGGNYSGSSSYTDWGSWTYGYYYDVLTTWPASPALGTMVYTNSWNWTYPDGQGGTLSDGGGGSETYPDIAQPGGFPWRYAQVYKYENYNWGDQDPEGQWSWTNSWGWSVVDSTRTRIDLHTGGATNSTAQTFFVLTVSAYDAETGETIDPTVIQIRGEYADTNGNLALTLSDNSIYDVTPTLPAAYSNYYFYVDTDALRPRIIMDFDEYAVDNQLIGTGSGVAVAFAAASPAPAAPASGVGNIQLGAVDVTDITFKMIIGEKISLRLAGVENALPTVTYEWVITRPIASGYTATTVEGKLLNTVVKTATTIDFYPTDSGPYLVTCKIKLRNREKPVKTTADIQRPTAVMKGRGQGPWRINANNALQLGSGLASETIPPGYVFFSYLFKFGLDDAQAKGSFDFVQLVTTSTIKFNKLDGKGVTWTSTGLDGSVPYVPSAPGNISYQGQLIPSLNGHDSPAVPLGDMAKVWRDDDFETYLFFTSNRADSIRVPIRKLLWSLSGAAEKTPTKWVLIPPNRPNMPSLNLTDGVDWKTHPQWNGTVLGNKLETVGPNPFP